MLPPAGLTSFMNSLKLVPIADGDFVQSAVSLAGTVANITNSGSITINHNDDTITMPMSVAKTLIVADLSTSSGNYGIAQALAQIVALDLDTVNSYQNNPQSNITPTSLISNCGLIVHFFLCFR